MTERRLATILAINVVGYSRMMQSDSAKALAALNTVFRSVVKPAVTDHDGRIVKLLGDGALIEFQSAFQALVCAVAVQKAMRGQPPPYSYEKPIFLRIGIHAGDVLVEGQDLFGDGVNIAARLQTAAEAGGILLSRTVADLASGNLPVRLRPEGTRSFKNIANPVETLSVDFADAKDVAKRERLSRSQEIRFCKSSDNVRLAWTAIGDGPPIVKAPNWIGHLELDWNNPSLPHLFTFLARDRRLIRFDARGNGLSDWEMDNVSFEHFVDDLACVFDVAGVERAPIIALSQGGAVAAAYAARHPERVSALVVIGGFAVGRARRKSQSDRERAEAMRSMMAAGWDDDYPSLRDLMAEFIAPQASLEDRRIFAEDMRKMISLKNLGRYREAVDNLDVTGLLADVRAPSLILHCSGDRMHPLEQGRQFAAALPDARFVAFDSNNHTPTENDPSWPLIEREIGDFLRQHG